MYRFYDVIGKEGRLCTVKYKNSVNGKSGYVVETGKDNAHFSDLSAEEQEKALIWIRYNVLPGKSVLNSHTSYGMKHVLDDRTNIYMTNNQFKEAMLASGFIPSDPDELNWNFYIKKSSPIFKLQVDGKPGIPMMGAPMIYPEKEYGESSSEKECCEGSNVTEV